jgi:hypothetical protein
MHRDKARQNDATRDTTGATLDATARALGVSVRTVQRRIKAGDLSAIERDGRRLVLLPGDATKSATVDATTRQNDATERDTSSRYVSHLETENTFLRGQIEAMQQQHALAMAAMREAMRAMPKALPAPADVSPEKGGAANDSPTRTNGPQKPAERAGTGGLSYGDIADWVDEL